jgi:hypothetical protein
LILTESGEVAVEDLQVGDRLVTRSSVARPIRWIGMHSYNHQNIAGRADLLPALIRRGGLGDTVPKRDLYVSPLDAMYLDGMLVPAFTLIDGEGALSESFTDNASRGMFHNLP